MNRIVVATAGLLALAFASGPRAVAQAPTPWLHVRVEEPGKASRVHVNVPLALLDVALSAAPATIESRGRLRLGPNGPDMSLENLRRAWKELRAAGDGDIVSVEDDDETVKIGCRGETVHARVARKGREEVTVEVPMDVVDALLSGEGDRLNVRAALERLQKRRGDIVRIEEKESRVRVWIDEGR
jgi:hypothetical protein